MIKLMEEFTTTRRWLRLSRINRVAGTWNLKNVKIGNTAISSVILYAWMCSLQRYLRILDACLPSFKTSFIRIFVTFSDKRHVLSNFYELYPLASEDT